ncbi:MAG TPA: zinc ribbon domain-containing protein [Pyrinomonadaceae bacterium]|nr:zinc ribbon domain-containing protein [Pyrinomonadaceae bacterium]
MFCPECGIEERHSNQFCRACGSDLRRVRSAVESPDTITASAVSARDEIGRAIAAKIRETRTAEELAVVAEEVLPAIEKFLESPEEKRRRRIRLGMLLSSIGLGAAIGISLVSMVMADGDVIFLAALGIVTFFLGLGFILNGVFLTVPRKTLPDRSSEADSQRQLDGLPADTNEPKSPLPASLFSSVTENTTQHLKEKQPEPRD